MISETMEYYLSNDTTLAPVEPVYKKWHDGLPEREYKCLYTRRKKFI